MRGHQVPSSDGKTSGWLPSLLLLKAGNSGVYRPKRWMSAMVSAASVGLYSVDTTWATSGQLSAPSCLRSFEGRRGWNEPERAIILEVLVTDGAGAGRKSTPFSRFISRRASCLLPPPRPPLSLSLVPSRSITVLSGSYTLLHHRRSFSTLYGNADRNDLPRLEQGGRLPGCKTQGSFNAHKNPCLEMAHSVLNSSTRSGWAGSVQRLGL